MMIVMSLIGSLGLFLYGLKTMSEGMQQAAGEKMRSILEVFTKNKLVSVLVGTFFTALIQSADGTAVLTMSFVNSGLLELSQSAGLLLGANLGSGVTGQMLSFDPEYLAPVLILSGVILTIAGRKKKMAVTTGQIFLGFGFLFVGISGFSRNLMMAGNISLVENIFQWIANPVLAVGTGFLLGMLFQSELAVMGLLAVLAGGEWLSLSAGLFMLLGANVGCSLSVALIGLGCKKEGKRVAGLQMLMNLTGGIIWIVLLFFWRQELEEFFLRVSSGQRNLALVNANMIMKLVWVMCLMPFTGWLIRGTKKLIPDQDGTEDTFVLKYIGGNHAFSPATAVLQAIRETEEMGKLTVENLRRSVETIQEPAPEKIRKVNKTDFSPATAVLQAIRETEEMGKLTVENLRRSVETIQEPAPEKIRKVNKTEQNINFLHREITSYLVQLKQSTLAIDDVVYVDSLLYMVTDLERIADRCERITNSAVKLKDSSVLLTREGEEIDDVVYVDSLLYMVTDLERIADRCERITNSAVKLKDSSVLLTREGEEDLRELAGKVERVLKEALEVFYGNDRQKLPDILATKEEISQSERELQAKYIERIAQDECSLEAGMIFADIISDLKLPDILATKEEISQSERELQAKYIERIAQDECSLEAGMIFADIISDLERVAVHGVNIACGAQEDI